MAVLAWSVTAGPACAENIIKFDENGNGSYNVDGGQFFPLLGALMPDPSNGGVLALTYILPAAIGAGNLGNGDVGVLEVTGARSDGVRFTDAQGRLTGATADRLIYYSDPDEGEGVRDLADTGFPTNFDPGFNVNEVGPEGNDGFEFGSPNHYVGISDAPVPEPSGIALFGLGALGLLGYVSRRRSA